MSETNGNGFSERDLIFIFGIADRGLPQKIDVLRNDKTFVDSILENKTAEIMHRIMGMNQDEMLAGITPRLLFEVLLRAARKELATRTYTIERTSIERIPVFDAPEVSHFIEDPATLKYLANMLASFTRVTSFTWRVRVRKGVWRRIRFNDMDIDSLLRYGQNVDEERRFEVYKRIGDLCLFMLGMFPEHAATDLMHQHSNAGPAPLFRRSWLTHDYGEEGRRFYRLAGDHPDARLLGQDRMLLRLHEDFHLAIKPLNYITEHYLKFRRGSLFPLGPQQS